MSQLRSQVLTSQILSSLQKSQDIRTGLKTFKKILQEAGIQLSLGDDQHILTQEQALVVRDLEKVLERCNLEEFMQGLKILCKKQKYFKKALLLTILRKNEGNETLGHRNEKIEQESLLRILLKVTCLQDNIIDILLKEIVNVASEATEDTSWLHMLLNPLKYLPYIKNTDTITKDLLDILDIATYPAQLEILDSIPEIIPDCQYSETAKQLCTLLDDKDELTGAIIDCLNALDLDLEMRSQVQNTILAKILSGVSLQVFPVLLSFLMTDSKSQNLMQILLKVRNALDSMMLTSDKNKEKESCKILIFNKLQTYALSSKIISEAWLNMISAIKLHSDHKPVDYLLLFMLHGTIRKRIIEVIFKKRIHFGLFKINQLEKLFEKYLPQQLFKDYFNAMVEIGCSLIRLSNDQIIMEYVSTMFKLLFSHEHTESIYRREILEHLVILSGASDKKTVGIVLKIISSFVAEKELLRPHTILLMKLLEKLDTFELKDVKQVFDILCSLTCGETANDTMSGLRDEIHMIIRKQLYSTKKNIKYRGIISAVVMARHTVLTVEEQSAEIINPITSVNRLPLGSAREAGALLELASTCTMNCIELKGLYYDQLASMLMPTNHLNKYFMAWLYVTITTGFEEIFATDTLPRMVNDINMSMQFNLNSPTETNHTPLGVNIAGLTLNNKPQITLLASYFRLLRLLHYRQHNCVLDGIDALLGCAVIMPDVDVDDLESDQAKQVANCLFYCVNWFREIISGFVTQSDKKLRIKVVKRLQNLLEVEQKLHQCLENIPDHKLPLSYFDITTEREREKREKQTSSPTKSEYTTRNPRKRARTTSVVNDADETANVTTQTSKSKKKTIIKNSNNAEFPIAFREMDTDLILLIKYPLKFTDDEDIQCGTPTAILTIEQLKFILKDFAVKLANLTQNKDLGLLHCNVVAPINLIFDGKYVLPNLDAHFQIITRKIKEVLEKTDGRLDIPEMFADEVLGLKDCFGLILEIFYLIFSWAGFQHASNLEILKDLLKSMRNENSQVLNSAHRMIAEFITRLAELTDQCLDLSHAINIIKIMEALYSTSSSNPEIQKKMVSVAKKLLSKRWYNSKGLLESGKQCNLNIDVLVKVYLSSADIKTIFGLVGTLQNQVKNLNTKEDCLQMLPSIDKQNFHVFYNGLCSALLNRVKSEIQSLTNSEHLILWNTTALTMQGLMMVAKDQETKTNLVCFLKKSIGILKVFLSHGIPIMEITLRSKPDDVVTIFKTMQNSTRFLHHLCCYSKFTKDSSLMAFVPKFRLTLETLIYRVKAALVANNCSEAFWMGNLRNKNLQGEDILSQSTVITDQNEDNSDEQLPEDDSEDELNLDESNADNRSVSSEVFD